MAASSGLNVLRNTSLFRRNAVFSILLGSVTRQVSSLTHRRPFLETRPRILRRNNSSLSKTELETSNSIDSVDIHGVRNIMEHPDFFEVHKLFTIRDLFDAKVHLGHHKGCWSPLMKPYLYGRRADYHIINLRQTAEHLRLALNVLSHIVYRHGIVLFVSTHPRFEELTQRTARECREYFITRKWRGGTFTNSYMVTGSTRNPDVVVFLHLPSLGRNTLAVKEAAQANIPSIGIVDSDCNPNLIMYPIPGNDDTPSAVELYCQLFKKAVLRAKQVRNKRRSKGRHYQRDEETPRTVVGRNEPLADAEDEE